MKGLNSDELENLIDENLACLLKGRSKKDAILELIGLIQASGRLENIEELKTSILHREELMSTGIGLGIAVPHTRMNGVLTPVAAVGISPQGIPDYESIDGEMVKIVILIVAGQFQHKDYIKALSLIVKKLKEKPAREKLVLSKTAGEICETFLS